MEKIFNSNMHCAGCKGNIEAALKKLDGVLEVNANLVNNVVKEKAFVIIITLGLEV